MNKPDGQPPSDASLNNHLQTAIEIHHRLESDAESLREQIRNLVQELSVKDVTLGALERQNSVLRDRLVADHGLPRISHEAVRILCLLGAVTQEVSTKAIGAILAFAPAVLQRRLKELFELGYITLPGDEDSISSASITPLGREFHLEFFSMTQKEALVYLSDREVEGGMMGELPRD